MKSTKKKVKETLQLIAGGILFLLFSALIAWGALNNFTDILDGDRPMSGNSQCRAAMQCR